MSGTKEERIEAIKFLIRIGIGWVVGMGAAVSVLASILMTGFMRSVLYS